jgi:hypothetical protein
VLEPDDTLDPELAALYAIERAAPVPDGATARVLAGVLAGITASAAATGAASAASTAGTGSSSAVTSSSGGTAGMAAGKVVAIAVASAIGGGAIAVVGYRELVSPPAIQRPAAAPEPMSRPDRAAITMIDAPIAPEAMAIAPSARVDAAPAVRPTGPRDVTSEPTATPDTREPLLIDQARTALRRGLVDQALETLMRHERLHPAGTLAEERDVLIIEAYVASGQQALARRRLDQYRRDYPAGVLRARVDVLGAELAP